MTIRKLLLSVLSIAWTASLYADSLSEQSAAAALAQRLWPRKGKQVEFVCVPSESDYYEIDGESGHVRITGNNANSLAAGLGEYMRLFCHVDVSWYTRDAVREPHRLPVPDRIVRRDALVKNRFFLNYCTFGYSLAWWQWSDWERLIDWMAIHGVTMTLANTGQEAVWQKVWEHYGITDQDCREYFTGPSYLAWHRMSNIDSWHGPLPQGWIDAQAELQKKIVAREAELGISPILSSFNGHVPHILKDKFPDSDIRQLSRWSGFDQPYSCWYLSPADPLFKEIQTAFLDEQRRMYGDVSHVYGVDPFNEVDPPSWDLDYLREAARMTYGALSESDPDAVWLQMGWLFFYAKKKWTPERIQAYLEAVPEGHLLMLDYYCEFYEVYRDTEQFYGQDFIWSYLGNFGGNTMMCGDYHEVSSRIDRAYAEADCMTGIGCTLEGLGVDEPMFEYVLSRAWSRDYSDEDWISSVADKRLGFRDDSYRAAWHEIYDGVTQRARDRAMIVPARPNMEGVSKWKLTYGYDNDCLYRAWGDIVSCRHSRESGYLFDCVNVARQCMENWFSDLFKDVLAAYKDGDAAKVAEISDMMLELLDDIDLLCGSDSYFLLGKWIGDARAWGVSDDEKDYFERDARMLITTWGGEGASLNDYAGRSYSGLVADYYRPRWKAFLEGLKSSAELGTSFDIDSFVAWSKEAEWRWASQDKTVYPAVPHGNPYRLSRRLYRKYSKR